MQTLFVLMLASLGLAGCGQKGDLFLPTEKPPVATPAEPAAEPASTQPEQQQPAATGTTADPAQHSTSNTKR
ncbi:LPS translocon maturation chaperone LptM [Rheinheimera riviphila]|nr:lipoprotein [Rheinheimera riviphila]